MVVTNLLLEALCFEMVKRLSREQLHWQGRLGEAIGGPDVAEYHGSCQRRRSQHDTEVVTHWMKPIWLSFLIPLFCKDFDVLRVRPNAIWQDGEV